jgi:cardiolipin synthase A/B
MRFVRPVLLSVAVPLVPLAMIGALHTLRMSATRRISGIDGGSLPPAVTDPRFLEIVHLLTGTLLRPGHEVEVLTDGDETYPRLWRDLEGARESITFHTFYFAPGEMADRLSAILRERARAGVRVKLLLDAFGASGVPERYVDELRSSGVSTAVLRPLRPMMLHKVQHRSHARVAVVDGRIGYTGGFGIADKWFGGGRRPGEWRETNVRFTGPAVGQLQASFAIAWAEATGTLLADELLVSARPETAGPPVLAGLLHTKPSIGSTAAMRFLALSLGAARERLWITNAYFAPTDPMVRLLVGAARRGVDVRILTANRRSDVMLAWLAGRARYEELCEAGVRIWEYEPAMMHAKTFVVDGRWSTVGALNMDNRSTALLDETTLAVLDREVGARLESIFREDLRFAREIELEQFRCRPVWERAAEGGANMMSRLL